MRSAIGETRAGASGAKPAGLVVDVEVPQAAIELGVDRAPGNVESITMFEETPRPFSRPAHRLSL